ncbi:hypothetical protein CVT91_03245 [Candidatus Atribacteria bacterium HGW-Atribacteria-1]|nr:MAG: hypothetical protein CVT91_03245 [Candidatus Atribacteria bacterium HGW-Atribacteria-1]
MLYSVLALLVFYVFLVDGNVESKVAIQEEIRARSIVIVDDEGQEAIVLRASCISMHNDEGKMIIALFASRHGGVIAVCNKAGKVVARMLVFPSTDEDVVGIIDVYNKYGVPVVSITGEDDGLIEVSNRDGKVIGSLP